MRIYKCKNEGLTPRHVYSERQGTEGDRQRACRKHPWSACCKSGAGFTLLEVLLYSAIVSIFLGVAFLAVHRVVFLQHSLSSRHEIVANQELVGERLRWVSSHADRILYPLPGATSSVAHFFTFDSDTNPAVFSLSSGQVTLSLASGTPVALTNDRVFAEEFTATHISLPEASSTLEVLLRVRDSARSSISSTVRYAFSLFE